MLWRYRVSGQHLAGLSNLDGGPVSFPGHVDTHGNRHGRSPFHGLPDTQPLPAGVALHSDRSQSLITSQEETARQGAEPPGPSQCSDMKAIPASPAQTRSSRVSGTVGHHSER
jgi:hypothetical protein